MQDPLFRRVLGPDFDTLPPMLQAIHRVDGSETWRGEATITRGRNPLVPLLARATQLPTTRAHVPTTVEFIATPTGETWRRDFGGARMVSTYRERNGRLCERLGLVEFVFSLGAHDGEILWATTSVRLFGVIPLPASWFARVRCRERQSGDRYEFLVEAALPLIGPLIRYEGWLVRD
jgi:hypothetical protein